MPRVCLRIQPSSETKIFRLRAADDVLRVLVDAHESEFTMRELGSETDHSRSTVWRAVELLDEVGVLQIRETAQRKYVSIDPAHLRKDDPILAIEQVEYQQPVRTFLHRVQAAIDTNDEVNQLLGVIVFGSVARGEADRKSDIDMFVLVRGDRTTARRVVSKVSRELEEKRFDGDRYAFEPFVETAESARRAGDKLREIFREGVTIFGTEEFQRVRKEIVSGEQ